MAKGAAANPKRRKSPSKISRKTSRNSHKKSSLKKPMRLEELPHGIAILKEIDFVQIELGINPGHAGEKKEFGEFTTEDMRLELAKAKENLHTQMMADVDNDTDISIEQFVQIEEEFNRANAALDDIALEQEANDMVDDTRQYMFSIYAKNYLRLFLVAKERSKMGHEFLVIDLYGAPALVLVKDPQTCMDMVMPLPAQIGIQVHQAAEDSYIGKISRIVKSCKGSYLIHNKQNIPIFQVIGSKKEYFNVIFLQNGGGNLDMKSEKSAPESEPVPTHPRFEGMKTRRGKTNVRGGKRGGHRSRRASPQKPRPPPQQQQQQQQAKPSPKPVKIEDESLEKSKKKIGHVAAGNSPVIAKITKMEDGFNIKFLYNKTSVITKSLIIAVGFLIYFP